MLKVDLEVRLDVSHYIEKMHHHLLLGPVSIPVRNRFGQPDMKTQGIFNGSRQLDHLADEALQHVLDGLKKLHEHPVTAGLR